MSEQKQTPIQEWIQTKRNTLYNGFKNSMAKKVSYTRGCHDLLSYLGLQDIPNPAEWIRILKEERVESHVSYWKEKAENSDWRYKELQSENERLKDELELHNKIIQLCFGGGGGKLKGEGGTGGAIHPNIIDEKPIG